jgi:hypothetical protein
VVLTFQPCKPQIRHAFKRFSHDKLINNSLRTSWEVGAPFKPLSWIFRLRLLGGYGNASCNHHRPGENGCHQLPIRYPLSRLVLGSKQSSFHHIEIALGNPLTCWSLRFPCLLPCSGPLAVFRPWGKATPHPPFPQGGESETPLELMPCYGRTAIRVWSRRTLRSAQRQLIWCQAGGMSMVAPTEGSETGVSVVSVVICFTSLVGYSNALALKDQREVCPLSREVIMSPLSRRLPTSICLFPHPVPTMLSVNLAVHFPPIRKEHIRFTTFYMCTIHGLGFASSPVGCCLRQENFEPLSHSRTFLVKLVSIFSLLSMTTFM